MLSAMARREALPQFVAATVLMLSAAIAPAQENQVKFDKNASGAFGALAGQAGIGFVLGKVGFENFARSLNMTRKSGGETVLGVWSGDWEGENETGRVTVFASFPDYTDRTQNYSWVRYDPPTEQPIPEALLSHLLAKAEKTSVTSGNTVELRLPSETSTVRCRQQYTLRLRMTSGALVSNLVETRCYVK